MTRVKISDEEALLDAQAAGFKPDDPRNPGTSNRWPGTCLTCGRRVEPRYNNIRRGHRACTFCTSSRVVVYKEKKTTVRALRTRETLEDILRAKFRAIGVNPIGPYPGSPRLPWSTHCVICDTHSEARPVDVVSGRWKCC